MVSWPASAMAARWTAMPNDVIGGWCVMAGDTPPSAAREPEVADFVTRDHAEHIADLHNKWLEETLALARAEEAEVPRG